MFCPNCGSTIADDARFCGTCGTKIDRPAAMPRPTASPRPSAPVAPAAPRIKVPTAANASALWDHLPLISSVAALVALLLPMFGMGIFGLSASMSGFSMIFGGEMLGSSYDGELANLALLAPGVLGLVSALALRGRAANVAGIAGGVIGVLLTLLLGSVASDTSVGELQIGFWLFALASVALVVAQVRGLVFRGRA